MLKTGLLYSRGTPFVALLFVLLLVAVPVQAVAGSGAADISTDRLGRLKHLLQTYIDEEKLAGAVTLVAKDGDIIDLSASGYQNIARGERMRTDAIFRLYSMTKPITSTALLMLFEEGYFQLDDPLEKYIPAFSKVRVFEGMDASGRMKLVKPESKITIRHIFTHTGGLSYANSDHPVDKAYREAGISYLKMPLQTLVEKIATMPLRQEPGTVWHYSFSHDVQARLVEIFSGMPFERFVEKRLFAPLKMLDTGFGLAEEETGRLAVMYSPAGSSGEGIAFEMQKGLHVLEKSENGAYLQFKKYPAGGSGLLSTANDYFRFAQMLANGGILDGERLLSPATVKLMTSPHIAMGFPGIPDILLKGSGYGLGVSVMVDTSVQGNLGSIGQFGWSGAASTHVIIDPKENMVSILLTQYRPALLPLQKQFQTLVYQSLLELADQNSSR